MYQIDRINLFSITKGHCLIENIGFLRAWQHGCSSAKLNPPEVQSLHQLVICADTLYNYHCAQMLNTEFLFLMAMNMLFSCLLHRQWKVSSLFHTVFYMQQHDTEPLGFQVSQRQFDLWPPLFQQKICLRLRIRRKEYLH